MPIYWSGVPSTNMRLRNHIGATHGSTSDTNVALRSTIGSRKFWKVSGGSWTQFTQGSTKTNTTMGYYSGMAYVPYYNVQGTIGYISANAFDAGTGASVAFPPGWNVGDMIANYNDFGADYIGSFSGTAKGTCSSGKQYGIRQFCSNITNGQMCLRMTIQNPAAPSGSTPVKSDLVNLYVAIETQPGTIYTKSGSSATFYDKSIFNGQVWDYNGLWVWSGNFTVGGWNVGFELS